MILNFEQFQIAAEVVERIINVEEVNNLDEVIRNSSNEIPTEKRREFYRHMNSLFLNVLLNRLDSTPEGTEQKTIQARRIIVTILNTL